MGVTVKGRSVSSIDLAVALWLLFAVGSGGGALLARSALRDGRLGGGARLGLFAGELVATALGLAALALGRAALASIRGRLSSPRAARAVDALALALAWLALFAYGVSWSLFWSVGVFLDADAVRLAAVDSVMLLKHFIEMSPVLLVVLPVASIGAVLGLRRGLGLVLGQLTPRGRVALRSGAAGLLALCLALAVWSDFAASASGSLVGDAASGGVLTTGQLFRHARAFRTGPMSHSVASVLGSGPATTAPSKVAAASARKQIAPSPVAAERPKIVPMSEYVASAGKGDRRNVLVLLLESLRPDVLPSTGGTLDVMPALERLAQGSRRFVNAYAQASHSDYADICPMSSQYPLRSRDHYYYPVHPAYPRVPVYDVLKAVGYRTAIISSQNEHWGDMYNYLNTGTLDLFFHAENFHDTFADKEDSVFAAWAKEFGHSGKVDDRYTVDEAVRWIGESDRPFFAYINLQSSHFPYRVPEDFPKRFEPSAIDFPYTFGNYPKDKLEVVKNRYRNSLAYMDAQLGRLFDFLTRTHRMDRTVIVATGDNGEAFYEHGTSAHAGAVFEEAVHVPLLVHAAGVEAGADPRLAQHIDIPATVLGALGLPQHPCFQGIDLLHAPVDASRSVYLVVQTGVHQVAMIRDGWKLIADYDFGRYSLYDLAHDPGETKDLSASAPDRVASMAGRLHAWEKAQLDYYSDPDAQRSTYPPKLSDVDP